MAVGALVPPDAACVTTRATLAAQQCTQMPQNGSERPFSPICVHSCVPTAACAIGRGYGSHDINDPMAPVMPGPRALGPDGPSVSCQVHVPVGPLPVWSSVCPCVWCRRWLESKTHALAGQTPPVLRLKAARYKTGGVVGHTAFERVCCVRRCHARSEPLLVDNHHIAYVCQIVELSRR